MSGNSQLPAGSESHPPGQLIERHRHDYDQLIYVSTGVLAIQVDAGAWVASRDRAIWIPAGTWHQHRAYGATSVHTVGFAPPAPGDSAVTPGGLAADGSLTVLAADGLLRELLLAYTEPGLPPAEARRIQAVLRDRLTRAHVRPLTLPAGRDPRLARVCALVEADLATPRTLAWLAARAGAGERTVNRLFRDEFGMTYPQWRTSVRVFHAMIALADGSSVTATAHACGWATTSAFIDTFARTMGQTPGAYRAAAAVSPRTG